MAEFLSKENINVSSGSQSTFNMNAGSLAQDLQTLMGSVSAIGKDVVKTQLAESERIGSILARDKLIELDKKNTEIQSAIQQDPIGFKYGDVRNNMDSVIADDLAKTKQKLGDDSPAYRKFEEIYLYKASTIGENIKKDMDIKEKKVANFQLQETVLKQLNDSGNLLMNDGGDKVLSSMYDSISSARNPDGSPVVSDAKFSDATRNVIVGKIQNNFTEDDAKNLYDGSVMNKARYAQAFNMYAGSVGTMDKNGNVTKKHSWVQEEDIAKIRMTLDSKTQIVKEKNDFNIGFHMAILDAKYKLDNTQFNSPSELKQAKDELYGYVKNEFSKSSSPSNSDQEKMVKFAMELGQKEKEFNDAYNVAVAADGGYVARTVATKQDSGGSKIDTEQVKRLVGNQIDGMLDKALQSKDHVEQRRIIDMAVEREKATGITGSMSTKFTTLIDFNKAKTAQEAESNLRNAVVLLDNGYTNGNEKLNKTYVTELLDVINEAKIKGLGDKEVNIALNQKKSDLTLRGVTTAPEALQSNIAVTNKIFSTDANTQELLGMFQSIVAGEVKANRGTKGNSFQEIANALGKTLSYNGIQLDSNRPATEGDNLDKVKTSGYVYVIDNPFWNAEIVLLPDVVEGSVKRPMNGDSFFDGTRKGISVIKNIPFENVDMDKVRTVPIPSSTGLKTQIIYDNVLVGTFSGNQLSNYYALLGGEQKTKEFKKVEVTKDMLDKYLMD